MEKLFCKKYMKPTLLKFSLFLIACFALTVGKVHGQISLVRDINSGASATGSNPNNLTVLGGFVYYSANDGVTGTELWRSNGTVAGTTQVKDINAGDNSSSPSRFTVVGSYIYFRANDGVNGVELWRTDGTASGTVMVADINPGITNSSPDQLTVINSTTLYFAANDGTNGTELWKTDVSSLNTTMIKDINPTALTSSSPNNFVLVTGTTVYFAADDGSTGREIWKSDGTSVGTVRIADINISAGSSPSYLTLLGSNVYFSATNGTDGFELWRTNGTGAGTTMVLNINATGSSSPSYLTAMGSNVYFYADNSTNGAELWRSDGTTTVLVVDIESLAGSSYPSNLKVIGSTLYFTASTISSGSELYKTTGSGATLININATAGLGSDPFYLTDISGTLYFQATDGVKGYELWKYNGTTASQVDILLNAGSSYPTNFTLLGSTVFFSADNGTGSELWTIPTSGSSATQVVDLLTGTGGSNPSSFVYNGAGIAYFAADDGTGSELWKTDGTPGGTVKVKDINAAAGGSNPDQLVMVGSALYFTAYDGTDTELWRSDGTSGGTVQIDINTTTGTASSYPYQLFALNSTTLIFQADNGISGYELWSCVGTTPALVEDINPGSGSSYPSGFKILNSFVYYQAYDATNGYELWQLSTTTVNATFNVLFANINAGSADSNPSSFYAYGGFLYFAATSGTTGSELWRTNGVSVPTLVKDINTSSVGASSFPYGFVGLGSNIYFQANDGVNGYELWKSDGTSGNTVMLLDIFPGTSSNSSAPANFINFNSKLFFTARTAANGYELWSTDGTAAGTSLFKDINPGVPSGSFGFPIVNGTSLYFLAADATGINIWVTDGVRSCATILVPAFSGAQTSGASSFTAFGTTKMIFSMVAQGYDRELFILDPALVTVPANTAINTHPSSQIITTGSPVTFTVSAIGTGLTYQWQKNSVDIPSATSTSYTIPAVAGSDAANYRCVVTGTCGTLISNQATLSTFASQPTVQPTAFSVSLLTSTSFTVSFTAATGSPNGYIALRKDGATPPTDVPVDGVEYTLGATIGSSTVAFLGDFSTVTFNQSGLTANSSYSYAIFAANGSNGTYNYLTATPLTGTVNTLTISPSAQPTALTFSNVALTSLTGTFTAATGSPAGYIVIRRQNAAPTSVPVSGTTYTIGNTIGDATIVQSGAAVTFNDAGLTRENTYHYKVFAFNGSGSATTYLTTAPLSSSQATVGSPPVITNETIPTIPSPATTQLKVIASIVENESSLPAGSVKVEYRSISSGVALTTQDMVLTAGKWESTLPLTANGEMGVEYKITATNSQLLSSNVISKATLAYSGDGITIPLTSFGTDRTKYRLISLPLELDPKTISAVLEDDLGKSDKKNWRIFGYDNPSNKNVELTSASPIETGKGYWLIVKENKIIDTGAGSTVAATQAEPYSIALKTGWNLIGNPYNFNVLWSDVLAASGLTANKLITYDGAFSVNGDTKLDKFEGGYVNVTAPVTLKFPVAKNSAAGGRVAQPEISKNLNAINNPNWEVMINLQNGDHVKGLGGIGMNENASIQEDQYDEFTIPRFEEYVEFNHAKLFRNIAYSKDVVPSRKNYEWQFQIETNLEDITELSWDNSYFGNNDIGLVLWDIEENLKIDMRESNRYSLKGRTSKSFKIFYGDKEYIESNTTTTSLRVHSISPNPTSGLAKIAFTLPGTQTTQVHVRILNIVGQPIATVFNGELSGGYHEVLWDGKDSSSLRPSTGIYLVEIRTNNQSHTSKILLN